MANTEGFHRVQLNMNNPKHVEVQNWVRRGYSDRLAGKGYRPEYETASVLSQRNYENGRLMAANLLLAGQKAPRWHRGVFQPRHLASAVRRAQALVGNFFVKPWKGAAA